MVIAIQIGHATDIKRKDFSFIKLLSGSFPIMDFS